MNTILYLHYKKNTLGSLILVDDKGKCNDILGLDINFVKHPARESLAWHCSNSSPVVMPAPV